MRPPSSRSSSSCAPPPPPPPPPKAPLSSTSPRVEHHACRLCPAAFHKVWLLDKHLHAKQVPRWPKGDAYLCPIPSCSEYYSHGLLLNIHLEGGGGHDQQLLGSPQDRAMAETALVLHNICTMAEARCPPNRRGKRGCPQITAPAASINPPPPSCRLKNNGGATRCAWSTSARHPVFCCSRCGEGFHVRCGHLEYVEVDEGKIVCGMCRKRGLGRKDGQGRPAGQAPHQPLQPNGHHHHPGPIPWQDTTTNKRPLPNGHAHRPGIKDDLLYTQAAATFLRWELENQLPKGMIESQVPLPMKALMDTIGPNPKLPTCRYKGCAHLARPGSRYCSNSCGVLWAEAKLYEATEWNHREGLSQDLDIPFANPPHPTTEPSSSQPPAPATAREEEVNSAKLLLSNWRSLVRKAHTTASQPPPCAPPAGGPPPPAHNTTEEVMADMVDCVACGASVTRASLARHVQVGCRVPQGPPMSKDGLLLRGAPAVVLQSTRPAMGRGGGGVMETGVKGSTPLSTIPSWWLVSTTAQEVDRCLRLLNVRGDDVEEEEEEEGGWMEDCEAPVGEGVMEGGDLAVDDGGEVVMEGCEAPVEEEEEEEEDGRCEVMEVGDVVEDKGGEGPVDDGGAIKMEGCGAAVDQGGVESAMEDCGVVMAGDGGGCEVESSGVKPDDGGGGEMAVCEEATTANGDGGGGGEEEQEEECWDWGGDI